MANSDRASTAIPTLFGSTERLWSTSGASIKPSSVTAKVLVLARADWVNKSGQKRNHTLRVRRKIGGSPVVTDPQVGLDSTYRCQVISDGEPADATFMIVAVDEPCTTEFCGYGLFGEVSGGDEQAEGAHGELFVMEI